MIYERISQSKGLYSISWGLWDYDKVCQKQHEISEVVNQDVLSNKFNTTEPTKALIAKEGGDLVWGENCLASIACT